MDRPGRRALNTATLCGLSIALSLGGAPSAFAQGCTGQAGTSALEQYCEAIPRPDGGRDRPGQRGSNTNAPSGSSNGSATSGATGGSASGGVNSATAKALAASGKDGAAVQKLAGGKSDSSKSTTPTGGGTGGSETSAQGGVKGTRVEGPSDPSSSPLTAATNAVESGPVTGPALVWSLLGLTGIGAIAAIVLRRRDALTPPGAEE